jgi:hypothetical protein
MSVLLRKVIRLLASASSNRAWQRHSALLHYARRQHGVR